MSDPKIATTLASGKRFYTLLGENYWSVTTILGAVPKRALIYWAANETAAYALENLDTLKRLHEDDPDGAYDLLKRSPWRKRDKAADLGTHIHEATQAHVLGKPFPEWPLVIRPRMDAFAQFLSDYQPEYEAAMTEVGVFNRTQRYAGTLDAIVTIGGRKLLIDMKTGGKQIYPETALQLAAYRHAEFVALPDGSQVPMPGTDGAAALHLPEAGGYELVDVDAGPDIFQFFLYWREGFRWLEERSKTVIGGTVPLPVGSAA